MPRHKTIQRLQSDEVLKEQQTKTVRVDSKTLIIVNASISDEDARLSYHYKRLENERRHSAKQDRTRNSIQKAMEP